MAVVVCAAAGGRAAKSGQWHLEHLQMIDQRGRPIDWSRRAGRLPRQWSRKRLNQRGRSHLEASRASGRHPEAFASII